MARDPYASLKHGLVGCWIPSISGSGLLLPDLSGRGNNGTLTNMDASDWVSSGTGRALDFDGSNDYAIQSSPSGLDIPANGNLTISAWVRRNTNVADYETIVTKRLSTGTFTNYELSFNNTSTGTEKAFGFYNGSTFNLSTTLVPLSQWTHIASVSNSSNTTYYVNGRTAGTSATLVGSPNAHPLKIGAVAGSPELQYFSGQLDDIRLYSRALTEAEIRLLASDRGIGFKPNKKLSRFSTRYTYQPPKAKVFEGVRVRDHDYASLRQGLVGAWCPSLPNGGSGNLLVDQSGRGNNGTLVGMGPEDWVASGSGRALDFTNGADYVAISNTALTAEFSASMWFSRRTVGGGDGNCLFGNTGSGNTLLPYVQASNYLVRTDGGASQSYAFQTLAAINHVVVLRDQSNNVRVFTNGIESTSGAKSISGTFTVNMIGRYQIQNFGLDGIMDDIRIYNRALTESEIRLLASKRGIGLQPSPTRFIAREKKTGLRRLLLTGQT